VVSGQHAIDQIQMPMFAEQNGDDGRRIERHTPSGP
jgi:hypothetical protein